MLMLIFLALSMIAPEILGPVVTRAVTRSRRRAALRRYVRRHNHYPGTIDF